MADLPETPTYDVGVYQKETSDIAMGGPDGKANAGIRNLANRTAWLKQAVDALIGATPTAVTQAEAEAGVGTTVRAWSAQRVRQAVDAKNLGNNITVSVGTGGDYASINAAIEALTRKYNPIYKSGGFSANINLLTGFVLSEQVLVNAIDLGWMKITSVDAQVTIIRSALSTNFTGNYPSFGVSGGGMLPVISALFAMDASGTATGRHGVAVSGAGSRVTVGSGCGVKNAGAAGLLATNGAVIDAASSNFSGALSYGVNGTYGSILNVEGVNATGVGDRAVYADKGSIINAAGCIIGNSAGYGIYAAGGSKIDFIGGDASLSGIAGVTSIEGSVVSASGSGARKTVGIDGTSDYVVASGGIIAAHGSTGGTSQAVNTLLSTGIIFK